MTLESRIKSPPPLISLIVAMAKNRIIGQGNKMPWHLPADLAHFKKITLGKPVIMGRKTFQSIGKPLPGRQNIVVSQSLNYVSDGVDVTQGLEDAIVIAGNVAEIIIIGGGNIYRQMLPRAQRLYLTYIDAEIEGDTQFPQYEHLGWEKSQEEKHAADEKNVYAYSFVTLNLI